MLDLTSIQECHRMARIYIQKGDENWEGTATKWYTLAELCLNAADEYQQRLA